MTMSHALRAAAHNDRHAQVIWFDPGVTTGIALISIRPRWLAGDGEGSWSGLGRAVTLRWFGQIGRLAKVWDDEHGKAVTARGGTAVKRHPGRINASAGAGSGGVREILMGRGRAAGGSVSPTLRTEIEQLVQTITLLDMWPEAAWGYESFQINQPNASSDYAAPLRLNARLEAVEILYGEKGRVPFTQSPSMAKSTATDDRLKAAGLYRAGMPHATDAARHVATFLRAARHDDELRASAWPRIFKSPTAEAPTAETG